MCVLIFCPSFIFNTVTADVNQNFYMTRLSDFCTYIWALTTSSTSTTSSALSMIYLNGSMQYTI